MITYPKTQPLFTSPFRPIASLSIGSPRFGGLFKKSEKTESVYLIELTDADREIFKDSPLHKPLNKYLKRTLDLTLAIPLSAVALVFIIPAAIIKYLEDLENPFFKQIRVGQDGKPILIYKIRSMKVNTAAEGQTRKEDSRITKVGKWLRELKIDEAPQFLNVLKGNMSLVGSRVKTAKNFELVPKYKAVLVFKPSLTGPFQLHLPEYALTFGNPKNVNPVELDINYYKNWNLLQDVKYIAITPVKITQKLFKKLLSLSETPPTLPAPATQTQCCMGQCDEVGI